MTAGEAGPVPTTAPPTCYRHPGRESYVRCQRCDRPICPDCMRPAAVGFQCPECTAAGHRAVRTPRSVFGGRQHSGAPVVTYVLVALNVLAYLGEQARINLESRWAMIPAAVSDGQYYRLITSAFLHANILHIGFNMWALVVVGSQLEPVLGRARFLALYLLSALGGAVLFYLVAAPNAASVGASGAVFGLFGALFVVARRLSVSTGGILGLIAINLVLTFSVRAIAWQDHVGGLVVGLLLATAFAYAPGRHRRWIGLAAPAVVLVVLAVLVVAVQRSGYATLFS